MSDGGSQIRYRLGHIRDHYGESPERADGWYEMGSNITIRQPDAAPLYIADKDGQPILTVHPDGRVTLDQPEKADEAAHVFADYVTSILRPQFNSEGAQQCS